MPEALRRLDLRPRGLVYFWRDSWIDANQKLTCQLSSNQPRLAARRGPIHPTLTTRCSPSKKQVISETTTNGSISSWLWRVGQYSPTANTVRGEAGRSCCALAQTRLSSLPVFFPKLTRITSREPGVSSVVGYCSPTLSISQSLPVLGPAAPMASCQSRDSSTGTETT